MDAAPSTPDASGKPSTSTEMADANAPFLGTPYIIDMQRPYEYPFPSPATESCPSLLLPYSHAHPSIGHTQPPLQLTHPFPSYNSNNSYASTSSSGSTSTASSVTSSTPPSASSLVHRRHTVDTQVAPSGYTHHSQHHHGSAQPYPPTSGVHPPISFRPSNLLRRRSSSHETHTQHNSIAGLSLASPVSMVPMSSVPVPPRLLGLTGTNGRWRKGRRMGSDGDGGNVK